MCVRIYLSWCQICHALITISLAALQKRMKQKENIIILKITHESTQKYTYFNAVFKNTNN